MRSLIIVRSPFDLRHVPRRPNKTVRYHQRNCRALLLGERQELHGKLAFRRPLNSTRFATQKPYRAENSSSGSSGVSPSASVCSISSRARSAAALVPGAAYPLICMRGVMNAT